jgi:hypothetical protein
MRTKLINLVAIALLAAACSSNETEVINHEVGGKVPVRVHVNEFSISVSGFDDFVAGTRVGTRAEDAQSYVDVKACVLAFYDAAGTEVYKKTQVRDDASTYTTFGDFNVDLQIGNYKMVALGYNVGNNDMFTLTSPTQAGYTSEKPREMFCLVQDVTVTKTEALDLDVTLDRIGAYLKIQSTDKRSAGVTKMRTTFSNGGKTFNPSTGLALTNTGFSQTNNSSGGVGETIEINCFPYLFTDEQTMDVTIEALDNSNNVLFTKKITDVEFKRGYMTTIKGPIFTAGTSAVGFQLNTEWGEGKTYTFE